MREEILVGDRDLEIKSMFMDENVWRKCSVMKSEKDLGENFGKYRNLRNGWRKRIMWNSIRREELLKDKK